MARVLRCAALGVPWRAVLPALAALAACAPAPPPATPVDARPAIPVSPPAREEPSPPPRAPAANRCGPIPRRAPRTAHVRGARALCQEHAAEEPLLKKALLARYQKVAPRSRVEVSFGCDDLGWTVDEVVVETGAGHGGFIQLWRFARVERSDDVDVLGLSFRDTFEGPYQGYDYATAKQFEVRIAEGRLAGKDFSPAVATARAALTASVRELPPLATKTHYGGYHSTVDVHRVLRLRTGEVEAELRYTGYMGTRAQRTVLPATLGIEALTSLTQPFRFEQRAPSDDAKRFFVERAHADWPKFAEPFSWWVEEDFLRMASTLGDRSLLPELTDSLSRALEAEVGPGRDRRLTQAVAAVASITGWDARVDADGKTRPVEDVAREYAAECEAGLR